MGLVDRVGVPHRQDLSGVLRDLAAIRQRLREAATGTTAHPSRKDDEPGRREAVNRHIFRLQLSFDRGLVRDNRFQNITMKINRAVSAGFYPFFDGIGTSRSKINVSDLTAESDVTVVVAAWSGIKISRRGFCYLVFLNNQVIFGK